MRRGILIVVAVLGVVPAAWLMLNSAAAPGDPLHTGRVRGSEINFYSNAADALLNFDLSVSQSGERITYTVLLSSPGILEFVNEARLALSETSRRDLERAGVVMREAARLDQFAETQEFGLAAGMWILEGAWLGGRTAAPTQWRIVSPSMFGGCPEPKEPHGPWRSSDGVTELSRSCPSKSQVRVYLDENERVERDTGNAYLEGTSGTGVALTYDDQVGYSSGFDLIVTSRSAEERRNIGWFIASAGLAISTGIVAAWIWGWARRHGRTVA